MAKPDRHPHLSISREGTLTLHLVRHGEHRLPADRLAGRTPGVDLSDRGVGQAHRTASRLAGCGITAIHSSPLDRTRQTAEIIASHIGLPVVAADALAEIDFGEWTGGSFADLDEREDWRRWNHFRSGTRAPGGETMLEAQARALRHIEGLAGGTVALVSHCDVIRAVLAHFLGMPIDLLLRLEIAPASISTVEIGPWSPRILRINEEP